MNVQNKQLYRSRTNRMIGGVCGGLGEFFGIDPTIVRLGVVIAAILQFWGALLVAYIIMMIVVPEAPLGATQSMPRAQVYPEPPAQGQVIDIDPPTEQV